jgi:hypothetical protein
LLSTVTASNSATVDVETTFGSTYDEYALLCTGVRPVTSGTTLRLRLKVAGTYREVNNGFHLDKSTITTTTYLSTASTNAVGVTLAESIDTQNGSEINVEVAISNPTNTNRLKIVRFSGAFYSTDQQVRTISGVGGFTSSGGALTGVRFLMDSGNISTGTFRLYGIRK